MNFIFYPIEFEGRESYNSKGEREYAKISNDSISIVTQPL